MKSTIYKISCKSPEIIDFYIGSTNNLINRIATHKIDCKTKDNLLYTWINNYGGFNNWIFTTLEEVECETYEEQLLKEREWIEKEMPTLNTYKPFRSDNEKKEYQKKYMEENRYKYKGKYLEKNREYNNTKVICELCGETMNRTSLIRHKKRKHTIII